MIFRFPWVLALIPVFLALFFFFRKERRGFIFPTGDVIEKTGGTPKAFFVKNAVYLRVACVILVIVALARPQVNKAKDIKKEGVAIV
ncbi:MAG: aerotolerance regulator BatA, partial [Candidatus Omnitrophica bacterium]|nr:aerotolerance regulator BatA [Candidatus Omnitrophota bacterium]